jgi:GNAT superfamily N-acetyltransferase
MIAEIRELNKKDDRSTFNCGDDTLNLYFKKYAGQNQFRHHIGVTYVAVVDDTLAGFATVSPASVDADTLPNGKKLPFFPVPVLRIARLAVEVSYQGRGIGKALLRFCFELAEKLRDEYGCVGLVVDAKREAISFYDQFGFVKVDAVSGLDENVPANVPMYLPLAAIPVKRREKH